MNISMAPHSGVLAYDFLDRPFPVVGWYWYSGAESGGLVLLPLVLDRGKLTPLNDDKVSYDVVGNLSQMWLDAIGAHNRSE